MFKWYLPSLWNFRSTFVECSWVWEGTGIECDFDRLFKLLCHVPRCRANDQSTNGRCNANEF